MILCENECKINTPESCKRKLILDAIIIVIQCMYALFKCVIIAVKYQRQFLFLHPANICLVGYFVIAIFFVPLKRIGEVTTAMLSIL